MGLDLLLCVLVGAFAAIFLNLSIRALILRHARADDPPAGGGWRFRGITWTPPSQPGIVRLEFAPKHSTGATGFALDLGEDDAAQLRAELNMRHDYLTQCRAAPAALGASGPPGGDACFDSSSCHMINLLTQTDL